MYSIGRLCVKIAGRDAGKHCLIVDEQDGKVLIDGQTRRRLVNPAHLEPLNKTAKIGKGADSAAVEKALGELGITIERTSGRPAGAPAKKTAAATKAKAKA